MQIYNILRFISLIPLIACVAIAPAQQYAPPSARAPFTMNIRLQHETVKAGAEVVVLIELTNTSDSEIELYRARKGWHSYTIKVLDSGKNAPALTAFGKALRGELLKREGDKVPGIIVGSGFGLSIAPGQTREDSLYLNSEFDLSRPGVYTIQLERNGTGLQSVDPATKVVGSAGRKK